VENGERKTLYRFQGLAGIESSLLTLREACLSLRRAGNPAFSGRFSMLPSSNMRCALYSQL